MSFPWSSKKDPGEAGPPQLPTSVAGSDALEFEVLTRQLDKLRELFEQASQRIAAYLVRRESQAAAAPAGAFDADLLRERIEALAEKVDGLAGASAARAAPAAGQSSGMSEQAIRSLLQPIQKGLESMDRQGAALAQAIRQAQEQNAGLAQAVRHVQEQVGQGMRQLDEGMQRLAELLSPPQAEPEPAPPAVSSSDWERAILGPDLAAHPAMGFQRQQLLDGILEGQPGACSLAGQLLVFQSSPAERLPQLLKDIGEAYYRWQPKISPGTTPIEEALMAWLQKSCEAVGINNAIELVHPGERFDTARHVAATRGVEITEVLGWIVLRDNGKVYTKAQVVVR
jgi:hypothetical protein